VADRPDRERLLDGVDPPELHRDLPDAGEPRLHLLRPYLREVELDVVVSTPLVLEPSALLDLDHHRAGDHIARRELQLLGCVLPHEPLAVLVEEDAAVRPRALRDEYP